MVHNLYGPMSNRASMACGEGTAMAETRKLAAFLRRMWSDSASPDAHSPAALQLVGYASAEQRAADESCLVPPALGRLLRPEDWREAAGFGHEAR